VFCDYHETNLLKRKHVSIEQAARITAITGATTHSIPCSVTLFLFTAKFCPGRSLGRSLIGGSHELASGIVVEMMSENGLEVYRCCGIIKAIK